MTDTFNNVVKIKMKFFILLITLGTLVLVASSAFADVRITVAKGDAFLCSVIATQAQKYNDRYVRHYNKSEDGERYISSDLWDSTRKGLPFFNLRRGQRQSRTVQIAFVDKYSTFWYYTKRGTEVNGPYFHNFIVPERESYEKKLFVDIDLELPCSCFKRADSPQRCVKDNGVNIHIYKNKVKDWWQQTGKDKATKTGKNVGRGSREAWEALKKSAQTIKEGWEEQKKREKDK